MDSFWNGIGAEATNFHFQLLELLKTDDKIIKSKMIYTNNNILKES